MAKIKCSICSYQFNIWYAGHRPAHILIWFLAFGQGSEACLTLTTGCLGIALQPSAAHSYTKKISLPFISSCYVTHGNPCRPLWAIIGQVLGFGRPNITIIEKLITVYRATYIIITYHFIYHTDVPRSYKSTSLGKEKRPFSMANHPIPHENPNYK